MTIGRDQLRALAVLRYWFGPDLERTGEGHPPRLAGQQLALSIPGLERSTDRGSRAGAGGPEGRRRA